MENTAVLREWFDRVDSEKEGSITASQLKNAFAVGNLEFPLSVVQQMVRIYRIEQVSLDGSTSLLRLGEVIDMENNPVPVLRHRIVFWGRGFLLVDDVYEGLVKIGVPLDSPAFYTVCESFDQKGTGRFKLDAFISLCIFVQSARNLFNSFDTSKQGRVTLDLNQFIYCTANCRI